MGSQMTRVRCNVLVIDGVVSKTKPQTCESNFGGKGEVTKWLPKKEDLSMQKQAKAGICIGCMTKTKQLRAHSRAWILFGGLGAR